MCSEAHYGLIDITISLVTLRPESNQGNVLWICYLPTENPEALIKAIRETGMKVGSLYSYLYIIAQYVGRHCHQTLHSSGGIASIHRTS